MLKIVKNVFLMQAVLYKEVVGVMETVSGTLIPINV